MNEIFLDTDILIDLYRENAECIMFFDSISEEDTFFSIITKFELFAGCNNRKEQQETEEFVSDFILVPIKEEESILAFDIYNECHLSHNIGILDSLIAATAITHNFILYTRNYKHYSMIDNLKIKTPY